MAKAFYTAGLTEPPPRLSDAWDTGRWRGAPALEVAHFRPESSNHRPLTQAKVLYNADGLFGIFRVEDRYVICRHSRFQDPVYKDSCVEFFLQPKPGSGYFNFEFNCGGALLATYITDPTRIPGGFKAFKPLAPEEGRMIRVSSSQPQLIETEITSPVTWRLSFFIPFNLFETYAGPLKISSGVGFKANFFKCADQSSHPHWAAWSPVDQFNFHRPDCFGTLQLM